MRGSLEGLRVGLDARAAVRPGTGIGRYTDELVRALGRSASGAELTLFLNRFRGLPPHALELPGRVVNPRIPHRALSFAWRRLGWPPVETFTGPLDVFHASDWIQPPLRGAACVTTIHDMGALVRPEWYASEVVAIHRTRNQAAAERADAIIAVSAFTRAEFLRLHEVDPEKVRVVHSGVSDRFRPAGEGVVRTVREAHGLQRPYLLYVGTREKRKNLPGLVQIFARVAEAEPEVDLALVGMRPWAEARDVAGAAAWSGREIEAMIGERDLEDRVHVLGHVSLDALIALYTGALAFVFPTYYEGFGFPALEAMACGAPVVASDRSAVPEVVGRAGALADPDDHDAFASAVLALVRDSRLRSERRARGLDRAAELTWTRTAARTAEVYAEVAGK